MQIFYYNVESLADAFEMASRDTKAWDFPAMEALAELAENCRNDELRGETIGSGTICVCSRGQFRVNFGSNKGYGIALLSLTGRESGVDDPTAAGILEFHRDRPECELYAEQLLISAEHVESISDLDAGYELLLQARLLVRTSSTVQVQCGVETAERPKYRLRRRTERIDE